MNYVQATTGSGGWPLNVFLTPDLEPVFGGTYWPGPSSTTAVAAESVTFVEILEKVRNVWQKQEEKCRNSAKEITKQLKEFAEEGVHSHQAGEKGTGEGLEIELLEEAYQHFEKQYDKVNGGLGLAPKFPTPVKLAFLLRLGQWPNAVKDIVGEDECTSAVGMAVNTLRKMARGGIRDQLGYGFARYSVTKDWSLPHFEKMLYDQGQLLDVYLDAFIITHDPEMLGAVYDIATYLTSPPMAAPHGGFYSAEDADSFPTHSEKEKREGAYYVWSLKEFQTVLGEQNGDVCARFYGVTADGNVAPENDPHDEFMSLNVLKLASTPSTLAKELGMAEEEVVKILKDGRRKLRDFRDQERPRPPLDDKIVVSWNGLAIAALARASTVLRDIDPEKASDCLNAAEKAVTFIRKELFDEKTARLWRIYREGRGDTPGFADDYSFFIQGLLELYEATFHEAYLEFADTLQSPLFLSFPFLPSHYFLSSLSRNPRARLSLRDPAHERANSPLALETQNSLFLAPNAGFYTSPNPSAANTPSDLLLRLKSGMDNAEPSSNNISARNLYRLSSILEDPSYARLAEETVQAFEAEVEQWPFCFAGMLGSVVLGQLGVSGIVVTGEGDAVKGILRRIRRQLGPGRTVVWLRSGESGWLRERNHLLGEMKVDGEVKVFVCERGVCREGKEFLED
ncbi:hypothetical protein MMC19_001946 [Ptychographa xylographoides]|nr:hypothetical protein [Ptychographa xylographoides]